MTAIDTTTTPLSSVADTNDNTVSTSTDTTSINTDTTDNDTDTPTVTSSSFSAPSPNITYRLSQPYTFYYTPPLQATSGNRSLNADAWGNLLKQVTTIHTIADYWMLQNNIKSATQLTTGASYHLFVASIKPEWEDSANRDGGKWQFQIRKLGQMKNDDIDELWLLLTMSLIGSWYRNQSYIAGCVLANRAKEIRFQVWTKDGINEDVQKSIGNDIKKFLNHFNERLEYTLHYSKSRAPEYVM